MKKSGACRAITKNGSLVAYGIDVPRASMWFYKDLHDVHTPPLQRFPTWKPVGNELGSRIIMMQLTSQS